MADVLAELENVLKSKPGKENITLEEEFFLQTCKFKAHKSFMFGAFGTWAVGTHHNISRLQLVHPHGGDNGTEYDEIMVGPNRVEQSTEEHMATESPEVLRIISNVILAFDKAFALCMYLLALLLPTKDIFDNPLSVTRSLTNGQRLNFSVASAVLVGMWKFNRSLSECVDQILGLEGSRMQWELANIILTRHRENSSKVQLVRKYFYPEAVFSDTNPDKSFYRWRPRHSFVDNTAVQRSEEAEVNVHHEKTNDPQPKKLTSNTGQEMAAQRGSTKDNSAHKSSAGEMIVDPLDCIFGHEDTHEVELSDKATALPRRRLRAHKRAHRRRHANHSENLDN